MATIQIVPTVKKWAAFHASSVHILCFSFLSLPILSPRYHKTLFQPEVSIRFWRDELMPRFVWSRQEHPSRCFLREGAGAAEFPFHASTREPPFLICPNPCLSSGSEMLAFDCDGMDWRLFKSCGGMKAKLTQRDYSPAFSRVECCIRLVNSGGGSHPCPFLWVAVHIWTERVLPAEKTRKKSLSK